MGQTYLAYLKVIFKKIKKKILIFCGKTISKLQRLRSSPPSSLEDLPFDSPIPLWIPTYEGTGQGVHPDIVPPSAQIPYYILAFTPYPFSYDEFENPSIVISKDGIRFHEEKEGLNPLVPPPPFDHNDDPDFLYLNGTWYLVYLETLRPERQNLILLSSKDRIHWDKSLLATYQFTKEPRDPLIVSPALLWQKDSGYLFYVNRSVSPYRIEAIKSCDIHTWDIHNVTFPNIEGMSFIPWHVDIFPGDNNYFMLITSVLSIPGEGRVHDLHIARSTDLENWECAAHPVFKSKPERWKGIYRSTGFYRTKDLYIYFSYETRMGIWRIGLVRKKLDELFPN